MKVLATVILLCCFSVGTPRPAYVGEPGTPKSPVASSAEDPRLGFNAVFPPVSSCLANVILVIYVQSLNLLEHMDIYHDMYGPYVHSIEFYVDGTWCDPHSAGTGGTPCYGERLRRSNVPDEVNIVDGNGGGWMMQRSFMHAATVFRAVEGHAGYLFMTDDVLLNIGQLSRTVREYGCDVIWRSAIDLCEDVMSGGQNHVVLNRFQAEARKFFEQSDEQFRTQLARNTGSPSTYCTGVQNDFLYMPVSMAAHWARVAQQMTDAGLIFTFAFYTAIFGIARMEDMVVLRSHYLGDRKTRSKALLGGSTFQDEQQPFCWRGEADVEHLLAMHIIHPNKISSPVAWNFALTLNPPGAQVALNASGSNSIETGGGESDQGQTPFWCGQ